MRQLKLQVQISVDGYIAGPNGEMDWMIMDWSEDLVEHVTQLTDPVGTILLGRNLAAGFIPHWTAAYNSAEPQPGAEKFVKTPKVVFSRKLKTSEWDNTVLAKGGLVEEVNKLKQEDGGDIIAYGGGEFVSSLVKEGLIDEYHLLVNPTVLGSGMPIFEELEARQELKVKAVKAFDCGITLLCYQPG